MYACHFLDRSIAATVVEMMTAEHPYKSDPQIKHNNTIIYMVCKNELNPLQSAAMRKLVDKKAIQDDVITFLTACFKRSVTAIHLLEHESYSFIAS